MKRMYLAGAEVEGPRSPTRLRIWVDSAVNSQSSMKSHRWKSDISCHHHGEEGQEHDVVVVKMPIAVLLQHY